MKTLEERYMLCKDCKERVANGNCKGKCKEYWKYIGATEQRMTESKLVVIVIQDDANTYFSAIDNLTGVALVTNREVYTYGDEFNEDEEISKLSKELGKEVLRVIYL